MRLTEFELKSISEAFIKFRIGKEKIYLFGSRTDSQKKGGDIDLLIVFENDQSKNQFLHLDFIVWLKRNIGERKIDLTLCTDGELKSDPFLQSVFETAVLIK